MFAFGYFILGLCVAGFIIGGVIGLGYAVVKTIIMVFRQLPKATREALERGEARGQRWNERLSMRRQARAVRHP
jgi:hypothetical protein